MPRTLRTSAPTVARLPFAQPHPLEMAPLLRTLQADGPIHRVRTPVGDGAWYVTGFEEVRRLLGDQRLGMSHPDPDRAARMNDSVLFGGRPQANFDTEHADRARFRSLVQPYFSASRMRAFRPRVDELVAGLLEAVAGEAPAADLHESFAQTLPILVICELLGVPFADREEFRAYSEGAAAVRDEARSAAGLADLWAYTSGLVAQKRRAPGDDLISGLCRADDGRLDDDYIAMIAAMILFAGHETTIVQIGIGAVFLLTNPAYRAAMLGDEATMSAAVEESLRAGNLGGGGVPRYARTELVIGDVLVHAGELVLLDIGAANQDPAIFPAPGSADPARDPNPHLTFGHGAHYCIGAPLARIELQASLPELARRFPTMRLAISTDQLRWRDDQLAGGFAEIPVVW